MKSRRGMPVHNVTDAIVSGVSTDELEKVRGIPHVRTEVYLHKSYTKNSFGSEG